MVRKSKKSQEKLRKMTKVRKSQIKMGGFEKKSGKFFFKHQILSVEIY